MSKPLKLNRESSQDMLSMYPMTIKLMPCTMLILLSYGMVVKSYPNRLIFIIFKFY